MPRLPTISSPKTFVRRFDRCIGEINGVLIALAVGLAVLDGTCFTALRIEEALANTSVSIAPISPPATVSALVR